MGMRYRKSVNLGGGVRLNLSAKSVSLSGGVPGARVTYNSKGYRTTSVGIPGTGLSYRATRATRGGVPQPLPSTQMSAGPPFTKRKLITATAATLFALVPIIAVGGVLLWACWGSHAYILAVPLTIIAVIGVPFAAMWIWLYALGVNPSSVLNAKDRPR
jgi:hypothetical protein